MGFVPIIFGAADCQSWSCSILLEYRIEYELIQIIIVHESLPQPTEKHPTINIHQRRDYGRFSSFWARQPCTNTNIDTCLLKCHGHRISRAAYNVLYAALDVLRCRLVDEKALTV